MHILPSRRPWALQHFFDQGHVEQPGVVVLDSDLEAEFKDIRYPPGWQFIVMPQPRTGYTVPANAAYYMFPNEPWYGMMSDDAIGRTPHWDTLLAEQAEKAIVWPNDMHGGGSCTFPFVPGSYCRALGWFIYPKFYHFGGDSLWGCLQRELHKGGGYMPRVKLEHLHFTNNKAKWDDVYAHRKCTNQGSYGKPMSNDEVIFKQLDRKPLLEKLQCLP